MTITSTHRGRGATSRGHDRRQRKTEREARCREQSERSLADGRKAAASNVELEAEVSSSNRIQREDVRAAADIRRKQR